MRLTFFLCVVSLALLAPAGALAQRTPRTPRTPRRGAAAATTTTDGEPLAPAPTLEDLGTIVPRLQSSNTDEVLAAIDQLSVIDDPAVVPPLVAMIRAGQPDAITERAIEALRGLAAPSSLDCLAELTHHRRPAVRRRAYAAIAAVQDPRARPLLEQGLRDSDRQVRGECADQLGRTGARASLDLLFRAFERGVIEAAAAIGRLGDESSVERFDEHLGHAPLSVMLSGYEQYLHRTDIDEDTKVDIVGRLGEVSGRTVREFLGQYLLTFSERDRSRLRTIVRDTLARIPTDAPARPTGAAAPTTGGAQ
jgi:HEAT repeat protein